MHALTGDWRLETGDQGGPQWAHYYHSLPAECDRRVTVIGLRI